MILYWVIWPASARKVCCLPLIQTSIDRDGPFLKLSSRASEATQLWACLKFSALESLWLIIEMLCSILANNMKDLCYFSAHSSP